MGISKLPVPVAHPACDQKMIIEDLLQKIEYSFVKETFVLMCFVVGNIKLMLMSGKSEDIKKIYETGTIL